jgi:uncharacterized protein (TIGR03546 family)
MLNQFIKLISVLNSNTKPGEIALGAVMGMFAAFLMGAPLNLVIIFLLLVIINANMPVFVLSMFVFKLLAFGIDLAGDKLGFFVLNLDFMKNLGSAFMAMPVIPFTKFNYTVIAGDFIIAVILTPLVWLGVVNFVPYYRKNIQEKVDKFKIVKMIKMSNIYKIYDSYKGE